MHTHPDTRTLFFVSLNELILHRSSRERLNKRSGKTRTAITRTPEGKIVRARHIYPVDRSAGSTSEGARSSEIGQARDQKYSIFPRGDGENVRKAPLEYEWRAYIFALMGLCCRDIRLRGPTILFVFAGAVVQRFLLPQVRRPGWNVAVLAGVVGHPAAEQPGRGDSVQRAPQRRNRWLHSALPEPGTRALHLRPGNGYRNPQVRLDLKKIYYLLKKNH